MCMSLGCREVLTAGYIPAVGKIHVGKRKKEGEDERVARKARRGRKRAKENSIAAADAGDSVYKRCIYI